MAGADMKTIKRRMKSVENTMQITKAMELVSSSKLRRAKERVEQARPYFNLLYQTMSEIAAEAKGVHSVYTEPRENGAVLLIIITGDRGLAGGFHLNAFRRADARIKALEQRRREVLLMTIGRKAAEYYNGRRHRILCRLEGVGGSVEASVTRNMAKQIAEMFAKRRLSAAEIVYTEMISPLKQEVCVLPLLPIPHMQEQPQRKRSLTTYEPSAESVFDSLIPQYLSGILRCAMAETFASELAARRFAMQNATDNAQEMLDDLSLRYHQARQAVITRELTEIIGGANAQQ